MVANVKINQVSLIASLLDIDAIVACVLVSESVILCNV